MLAPSFATRGSRRPYAQRWICGAWDFEDLVRLYPTAVRRAARVLRDWRRGEEVDQQGTGVVAAARAVAMHGPRGAQLLVARRPEMAEWAGVQGSHVVLKQPVEFAEEVRRRPWMPRAGEKAGEERRGCSV